jgi:hypothetical protein
MPLNLNKPTINIPCDLESPNVRMMPRFRNSIRYRADLHLNPISESQKVSHNLFVLLRFFIAHDLLYFRI